MAGRGANGGYPPRGGDFVPPFRRQDQRNQDFNAAREDRNANLGAGGQNRSAGRPGYGISGTQGYPQRNFRASGPSNFERGEGSGATNYDQHGPQSGDFRGNFGSYNEGFYERGNRNFQGNMSYNNNQRFRNNSGNFGAAGQGRGGSYGSGRLHQRNGSTSSNQSEGLVVNNNNVNTEVQGEAGAPAQTAVYRPKEVGSSDQQRQAQEPLKSAATGQQFKAKPKQDKTLCFRCKQTGHIGTDCDATLCVFCDSAFHVDEACPLPKMPKPTAVLYGMAREALMYFKVNRSDNLRLKNDTGKVGRIKIAGGKMSAPQVLKELDWLVPGNHAWEIFPAGETDFRVVFPTKADLLRLKRIKHIEVEGTELSMHFEDWSSKLFDKWGLYDIWVRITGCPDALCRDYLALFAVGSLIGETKEVDMKFTRENGVVRARVDCANPEAIPRTLDFLYEGEGYGVLLDIEAPDGSIVAAGDFTMHDPNADDGDKQKDKEDHTRKENSEETAEASRDKDKNKNGDSNTGKLEAMETDDKPSDSIGHIQFGTVSSPTRAGCEGVTIQFTPIQLGTPKLPNVRTCGSAPRRLWSDRVEDDEDSLPSPLAASAPTRLWRHDSGSMSPVSSAGNSALSAMAEPSTHASVQTRSQPTASEISSFAESASNKSDMQNFVEAMARKFSTAGGIAVTPPCPSPRRTLASPRCSPTGLSPVTHTAIHSRHEVRGESHVASYVTHPNLQCGTGVFLGGRFSEKEVIAYGGIPEAKSNEVRSSARLKAQPNADDTQMARAQQRLQDRDELGQSGYTDGYQLDPYVVLPTVNGQARRDGFWVQPPGIGGVGSIFPVQLAF